MKHTSRLYTTALIGFFILTFTASAATFTRTIDREYTARDFQKLLVKVDSGRIDLVGADTAVINMTIDLETKAKNTDKAEELFDLAEVIFNEESPELSLVVKQQPRKGFMNLFSFGRNQVQAKVRVQIPDNYDIRLDTGSGGIDVANVTGKIILDTGSGAISGQNLTGEIVADTGSGGIHLSSVEGTVHADTGSGQIVIKDLSGEFSADTGSGSVNADGHIHRFRADTGSGSVEIYSLTDIKDRSVADTGSGHVQLRLPDSAGFVLDADVGSGGIDCGFPIQITHQNKSSLRGVANGGGPVIRLDTGSGGISVQPIR